MTCTVYSCFLPFPSSNLCGHFECISFQFFNDFYLLTYMPIFTILFHIFLWHKYSHTMCIVLQIAFTLNNMSWDWPISTAEITNLPNWYKENFKVETY